ncbi:hypothetical protein C173_28406 [Paenibacillus sp. FSL R7-277]|uniref:YncE family protein n=1 Tax=unclassified Paenibacillus TaxID=185978 RepID=UPI0003E1D888|nr:YncE family protein [Paenibacillus sp. FSL R7-277]ETT59175.1 hypothetical protein C173_28406 [Paenibacillus sp. FSL R7-277]
MNMNRTANRNRNTRSGLSYVYVSYVSINNNGYVAVIDPTTDQIIKRISAGYNPTAMCLSPSGDKLYVADGLANMVYVYSTDTFNLIGSVPVDNKPVAILVEPSGKKVYVANYGYPCLTIFDAITLSFIGNLYSVDTMSFAISCNENSPYVYVACNEIHPTRDSTLAIRIINNGPNVALGPAGPGTIHDSTRNFLTVHPNGHTLVELGNIGALDFLSPDNGLVAAAPTSSLDNTVSGIYLDNGLLFCTMREERNFLKLFKNLDIDVNSKITYDDYKEIPSYKGQDKIRTSLTQKYIGVTIQATDHPTGGLQIYDVDRATSRFVELTSIGDLAFFSDTKAYVGGSTSVQPIDLTSARPLNPITIGTTYFKVKNVISGYSNQT